MKLSIDQQINGNVYSANIKFGEFGSPDITADEEKELIQDFAPQFNLRDIEFKGQYLYDKENKIVKKYIAPIKPEEPKENPVKDSTDTVVTEPKKEDVGVQTDKVDESKDTEKEVTKSLDLKSTEEMVTLEPVNVIAKEEPTTGEIKPQEISVLINDRVIKLDDKLELQYMIKAEQIMENEIGGSLIDKGLVAQAKVQLVVDKITEKVAEIMKELKERRTNFEKVREITI